MVLYENIDSDTFYSSISNKREFRRPYPKEYLRNHQRFLTNYIGPLTTYNSVLVAHQPGLGKTLTSISIAENFKSKFNISVFTKNGIIESNFKRELISYYLSDSEKKIYFSQNKDTDYDLINAKKELNTKVTKEIDRYYTFGTYSVFSVEKDINLSNNIIIIDEVHNIINNDLYTGLMKTLANSNNFKIVLLSATPMFDNITEIFEISNILNADSGKLIPIRNDLVTSKLIVKNDSVYGITETGSLLLKDTLRGKISFLMTGTDNFPKKIFQGSKIQGGNLKIFKTIMTKFQEAEYKKVVASNEKDILFKNVSDIATIVYPDSQFGKPGFTKYKKNISEVFTLSKLAKYSPKLHFIVNDCIQNKGKIFIYSNYVTNGGTELIDTILSANGFSRYLSRAPGVKYVVLGESTSTKERKKILSAFNSKENLDGSIIKVIVGSPVLSEGITFKAIRRIHILEPHWNLSRIDQIIGRGVRLFSHSDLPVSEQTVKIFLHCCVNSSGDSIDLTKYITSEKKDKEIAVIIRLLKEIAVDCSFNKKQNTLKETNFSRECDYTKCDFKCNGTVSENVDPTTYSFKQHFPREYSRISTEIAALFKTGFMFDLAFIQNITGSESTKQVLTDIILNKVPLINPNGDRGNLLKTETFYYIQPVEIEKTNDFFYKMFKIRNKVIPFATESPVKPRVISTFSGEKRNGEFYIVIKNQNKDLRKVNTGRKCGTYPVKEIKKFFTLLGSRPIGNTKDELCKNLELLLLPKK